MARPKKDGLLYFSFDVDFFSDKKIKSLRARYKNDGITFYIYLLTEIYRNGYYIRWDEDYEDNAIVDLDLTEGFIKQVMTFLTNRSLLTSITVGTDTIITSPGIQKRYQEAVKGLRRDVFVNSEIWLLSKEETATCIKFTLNKSKSGKNSDNSSKNKSKSSKNSTNEMKRKEIKEIEKDICSELEKPALSSGIQIPLVDGTFYDVDIEKISEWKDAFPAVDVEQQLKHMIVWCNENKAKRKTRRGVGRFIVSWLSREQDKGGRYRGYSQPPQPVFYNNDNKGGRQ